MTFGMGRDFAGALAPQIDGKLRPYLRQALCSVVAVGSGAETGQVKVRLPGEDMATADLWWAPVYGAVPAVNDVVRTFWDHASRFVVTTGAGGGGGAGVTTFEGRSGVVVSAAGDYTATEITNTPAGTIAATTVQAAINELDTEKAVSSHTHAAADIASGTMATARLGSGTADSTTYLRGDQTWATVSGGSGGGSYAANIGDGSTTQISVTHSLGTRDVVASVRLAGSPYTEIYPDITMTDINTIRVDFDTAPTTNQYRVTVVAGGTILAAPDASTTVKGVAKLSAAPTSPTDPIAVGTNDTQLPSQGENDALQGTSGTPSNTNRFVTNADSRNTDARTPTAHATTHTNGTDDIQSATASQKGLMTSTYASKLDGIEASATADQTAAEILTAIKTVDGSGSGLDADLLDGINSAGFATASHTHAAADTTSGVFSIARLATGTPDGTKFVRDDGTLAVPAGSPNYRTKLSVASDVANATTSFADVTGLTFAATSGVHYQFYAVIDYTVNATTTGVRFSMNGPAMTRGSWRISLPPISGAAPYVPGFTQQVAYDTGTASASHTAVSPNLAIIEGFILPSASGTIALRFASEVAVANGVVVKAGSTLEYW